MAKKRKKKQPSHFQPPSDIKAFWLAPHCGPGTNDIISLCGFCDRTHRECAEELTEVIRLHPEGFHDGCISEDGCDDPDIFPSGLPRACGGSGFWCSGCGRFWAQDSCGNSSGSDWLGADKSVLVVKDNTVHCVCGKPLMRLCDMS